MLDSAAGAKRKKKAGAKQRGQKAAKQQQQTPFAALASLLKPLPTSDGAAREALEAVAGAAKRAFGEGARAVPFGSFVQGAQLPGSDLDVCLQLPGFSRKQLAGTGAQVSALKAFLARLPKTFRVIEKRFSPTIKVPIVVLAFASSSGHIVETDVSIGVSCNGAEKGFADRLVRKMLACTPSALWLVRVVKHWARVQGVSKAFDGFLNSLSWTILVLYWLMRRDELDASVIEDTDVRDSDGKFSLPEPLACDASAAMTSGDLADFFSMVAGLDDALGDEHSGMLAPAISLLEPQRLDVCDEDSAPLFIEDPGVRVACGRRANVARALRPASWRLILQRCGVAARRLRGGEADVAAWTEPLLRAAAAAVAESSPPTAAPAAGAGGAPAAAPGKRKRSAAFADEAQFQISEPEAEPEARPAPAAAKPTPGAAGRSRQRPPPEIAPWEDSSSDEDLNRIFQGLEKAAATPVQRSPPSSGQPPASKRSRLSATPEVGRPVPPNAQVKATGQPPKVGQERASETTAAPPVWRAGPWDASSDDEASSVSTNIGGGSASGSSDGPGRRQLDAVHSEGASGASGAWRWKR